MVSIYADRWQCATNFNLTKLIDRQSPPKEQPEVYWLDRLRSGDIKKLELII